MTIEMSNDFFNYFIKNIFPFLGFVSSLKSLSRASALRDVGFSGRRALMDFRQKQKALTMLVKNWTSKNGITVSPHFTVNVVARILVDKKKSGVPVEDAREEP